MAQDRERSQGQKATKTDIQVPIQLVKDWHRKLSHLHLDGVKLFLRNVFGKKDADLTKAADRA